MKISFTYTFFVAILLPMSIYSQSNGGSYLEAEHVGIGANSTAHSLYVLSEKPEWQNVFINGAGTGANVHMAHGEGFGMHIRGYTVDNKYTLQLYNKNEQTNIFYNNGLVGLGLVGNVGIGTTNPLAKLHVNGAVRGHAGSGSVRLKTDHGYVDIGSQNHGYIHFLTDRPRYYFDKEIQVNSGIISSYDDDLTLSTYLTPRLTISKDDGKVRIGNISDSTPGDYKLYVEDGILTEKVRVAVKNTSDWADYVFEKDYELMSINDLEEYIATNKHLPNIPAAEEMVEKGLDVVATNSKLLEKIEEAHLYIIELHKEIEQMKNVNNCNQ